VGEIKRKKRKEEGKEKRKERLAQPTSVVGPSTSCLL
jgi:hypothetical protein